MAKISLMFTWSRNVTEVAADFLPYYDLLYIQVKQIIEKENCRNLFMVVDWMEADLNVSLQSIVRKGWGLIID